MVDLWKAFWTDESGQDLAEYAILLALIALIVIAAVALVGQGIEQTFQNIAAALPVGAGS